MQHTGKIILIYRRQFIYSYILELIKKVKTQMSHWQRNSHWRPAKVPQLSRRLIDFCRSDTRPLWMQNNIYQTQIRSRKVIDPAVTRPCHNVLAAIHWANLLRHSRSHWRTEGFENLPAVLWERGVAQGCVNLCRCHFFECLFLLLQLKKEKKQNKNKQNKTDVFKRCKCSCAPIS